MSAAVELWGKTNRDPTREFELSSEPDDGLLGVNGGRKRVLGDGNRALSFLHVLPLRGYPSRGTPQERDWAFFYTVGHWGVDRITLDV